MEAPWAPLRLPGDSLACAETYVFARARADTAYGAWWQRDSIGVSVAVARTPDGGISWETLDARVRGRTAGGCERPHPAVAADSVSGQAAVAWVSDSARRPQLVVERLTGAAPVRLVADSAVSLGLASLAVADSSLAVAWDAATAGAESRGVWLAMWRGASHIRVMHSRLSAADTRAFAPSVAIGDGRIVAAWHVQNPEGRRLDTVIREGTLIR